MAEFTTGTDFTNGRLDGWRLREHAHLPMGEQSYVFALRAGIEPDSEVVLEVRQLPLMWSPGEDERAAWALWFRRHGGDMDRVYLPNAIHRHLRQYQVSWWDLMHTERITIQLEGPPLPFPPLNWS